MSPLNNTVVIPDGWSAHHRPVTSGAQTATVSLAQPGVTGGSFNATTGARGGTPNTPYVTDLPARIMATASAGAEQLTGEQQVTTTEYQVTVDWTLAGAADVKVGHLVKVLTAEDSRLVGRTLLVRSVVYGSLEWERILIATDDLG
jgi:hypothetical protein